MQRDRIPPSSKPQPNNNGLPAMLVFVLLCGAVLAMTAAFYPWSASGEQPTGRVDADDGDPYFVTPEATPARAPELALELALPALSDLQYHYAEAAKALPVCPLCFGVDKPPISMSDNEIVVFVALLYTESHLSPYDDYGNLKASSAGCMGIAQLCGGFDTPDTRKSQMLAIWTAADYFARLVDDHGGDFTAALRSYKGVTTPDTTGWQADTVWSYVRIRGSK